MLIIGADEPVYTGQNSLVKIYLDTIITTLTSILKTILWFIIVMISTGWQIYKNILTREEMRRFIALYVFIYLAVCFDQIIDIMANARIGRVYIYLLFSLKLRKLRIL